MLRAVDAFGWGLRLGLVWLAILALATLLFGRVYCAVVCPLGIWQDIVARTAKLPFRRRRRGRERSDAFARRSAVEAVVRLVFAGVVFGMLAAGFAAGFLALDPYSIAWRGAWGVRSGARLAGALAPLAVVTALAAWRGRLFCTALCPVGTVLGLLSRRSPARVRFTDACVKCGACAAVCPSHCIDVEGGVVDSGRCVRCLACVSVCKVRGIQFSAAAGRTRDIPFSASRRAFLKGTAALVAGLAAGAALAKAGARRVGEVAKRALGIVPPGAGSAGRFAGKCTGCPRCVGACPGRIIRPAQGGLGPVRVDLSGGHCVHDCHRCAAVCPTGAIRRLPLEEKKRTRIAQVEFHADHCVVFQTEEWCGRCADACPTGALSLRRNGTPKVAHPERCIGCGACQEVCPGWHADDDPPDAVLKAMRVVPLPAGVQTLVAEPDRLSTSPNN